MPLSSVAVDLSSCHASMVGINKSKTKENNMVNTQHIQWIMNLSAAIGMVSLVNPHRNYRMVWHACMNNKDSNRVVDRSLQLTWKTCLFICLLFLEGISDPCHLLKCTGVEKGSKEPKQEKVGKVTIEQLRAIATEKLPDLNCTSIESAMRIIAGTAANMGIVIDPPVLEPKKKAVV